MAVTFLGQFLLNRGVVNRHQLLKAIELQESGNKRFGDYAVTKGFLSQKQCDRINLEQQKKDRMFGEIAIEMGLLTQETIAEISTLQKNDHLRLGGALIKLGHLDPQRLATELAAYKEDQRAYRTDEVQFPPGREYDKGLGIPVDLSRKLFLRIAGIQVKLGEGQPNPDAPSNQMLTVAIDFKGDMAFTFVLTLPFPMALPVAKGLLQTKDDLPEEDVADALGEFSNVICGNACAKYAQAGKRVEISPPYQVNPEGVPTLLFPLHMADGRGEIRLYIK